MKPQLGQTAKVYRLGKTDYAVTRMNESHYVVYRSVRGNWQVVNNVTTLSAAFIVIFSDCAVQKGNVTI